MRNVRKGIYPGSFDPLTNGHLDIINRAALQCDYLYVAVARNSVKTSLFTVEERVEILKKCCPIESRIEVVSFDGLLAGFCEKNGVSVIFRGLRATADFEYEQAIALMNRRLSPDLETLFLVAGSEYSFISSRLIKEVALNNGDVSSLVPPHVLPLLKGKFSA